MSHRSVVKSSVGKKIELSVNQYENLMIKACISNSDLRSFRGPMFNGLVGN